MQSSYQVHKTTHPYRGISIVVALHLFLGWALVSGTASQGLTLLLKPMQAVLIQEVAIQPPPPPPPKQTKQLASKPNATPPPYIPPVEVAVAPTAAVQMDASPTPPPAPVHIAPAPIYTAPAHAASPPAPPARNDIATVCPTQVAPEMPRRALIDGTQGVVRAQVTILDGVVRDVLILSGPRIFQAAVRSAMLQYKCTRNSGEVVASQEFNFRLQ